MKGLTTPLSRWLRGSYLFVLVRWTCAWPPTGLIPWFSKTEGNTYATLLHHPLLFGENQRSAQEVERSKEVGQQGQITSSYRAFDNRSHGRCNKTMCLAPSVQSNSFMV